MPTLEENKSKWDDKYHWKDAGEEWSNEWGTSHMQWYGAILPRIRTFLPANTILEIAPGFGRWTNYLKDFCNNLVVVDLSNKCIEACQARFKLDTNISYFINDGKSLRMIPDHTIDFIFSFDSLVHVEDTIISIYTSQFPRILKRNGVAFIHHSNLGEYLNSQKIQREIQKIPKLLGIIMKLGILDDCRAQWRDQSMTARKMQLYSEENGLRCISQELITWGTKRTLIDCLSTIVNKGSDWSRDNRVYKNKLFVKEAKYLSNLSRLYDWTTSA